MVGIAFFYTRVQFLLQLGSQSKISCLVKYSIYLVYANTISCIFFMFRNMLLFNIIFLKLHVVATY